MSTMNTRSNTIKDPETVEIDISIVTYNSERWLHAFITSLVNQNYPKGKISVYITDNSSIDNTYLELCSLKKGIGSQFKKFEIYQKSNLGYGHGHNHNMFKGGSQFVLVTNVDLEFEPNSIFTVVDTAIHDDADIASWELRQKPYEHPKDYNPLTLETSWSSSACILFRREAIEKVGGYEKRIFMYGEDVELSYRLRDHGYKLKYCPKAVCLHHTYEHENQLKPLQFLGSTLSNVYIRLRFGNFFDIVSGFFFYFVLLFTPTMFDGQKKGLLKNFVRLIGYTPYFLWSRKKSNKKFFFNGWDYELAREGAFYSYNSRKDYGTRFISVIVRTYGDRLNYLKEAITSIGNQTYPNIEIVVVEDGTRNAEKYVNNLRLANVKSVIYKSIEKAGRCKAGNTGLSSANGEYLIFLDDDDLFYPEHLEVLSGELEMNPDIYASYSNAFEIPTKVISMDPLDYIEIDHYVLYKQEFSRPLLWHHNYIPIQSILFKRELYDNYGGFDEELDNLEDWNLWTRYSLIHDFKYIPKTTSIYRVPADRKILQARQSNLDVYYKQAVEKQKDLCIETNPAQIIEYCLEVNKQMNLFQISVTDVQGMLKKHRMLNKFYHLARKFYYKFK